MIEFHPDDINPSPDDVCDCAQNGQSGTFYLGYERCRLCGLLIVTSYGQRAQLAAERQAAESARRQRENGSEPGPRRVA